MRILFFVIIFWFSSSAQFMDPQNAAILAELKIIVGQNVLRNADLAKQLTEAIRIAEVADKTYEKLSDIKEYEEKIRRDIEALEGMGAFSLGTLESMVLEKLNHTYANSVSRKFIFENIEQILKSLQPEPGFNGKTLKHQAIRKLERKTNEEAIRLQVESIKAIEKQSIILSEQAIKLKQKADDAGTRMEAGDRLSLIDRSNELMRKSIEYKIQVSKIMSETSRLIFQQLKDKTANREMVESIEKQKKQKRRYGLFDSPLYTR